MASSVHTMRSGETMGLFHPDAPRKGGEPDYSVSVGYRAKPAAGRRSQGGTYTVSYPGGRTETYDHGPLDAPQQPGRAEVAGRVQRDVVAHLHARQAGFRDRRF